MISNRGKKLKIICSLVILVAIAAMPLAGISNSSTHAAETSQFRVAPINPDFLEFWENPPETFYGYIPPPVDLSHLREIPVERAKTLAALPISFDWRTPGKVTSVKDQNPCGTCWAHGTLAAVESKVLIEEIITYDFSEQNLVCCTDPAWVYLIGNRCNGGGWSWLAMDTLSKKGTRLESCQPYNTNTINTEACDDGCTSIKRLTGYRLIANSPHMTAEIKNAIHNEGPVSMSYCMDEADHMYPGSVYYWPGCPFQTNHLVSIVGWDDTIAHPEGGGYGAWIVKNSWGTGWGDNGYFYLCYGSANMDDVVSYRYEDYDPNEKIYYWDEAGWVGDGGFGDSSAWMANVFTSEQNGTLSYVEFWTTSNNAQYEIYVYLDGDISDGLQNLAASRAGTCQELGYYSILLTTPVSVTNSQQFTVAVKMTTPGYNYPIPVEVEFPGVCEPPIQSGVCFARHRAGDPWIDASSEGGNVCLRARIRLAGATNNPPNIPSNPLPPNHTPNVSIPANLSWSGGDPDASDTVTYGVYFGTSSPPPFKETIGPHPATQSSITYDPGALSYNTKYYWKIVATDNHSASTTGPLWDFTTSSAPNNPPQLSSPSVQPPSGTPSTGFYHYVNYYDSDGDSASVRQVYVDGIPYAMSLYSGTAFNGVYRYGPKNLSAGSHNYYFYFTDGKGGTARLPASGSYSGPVVSQENNPPNTPSNPSPGNHATGVSINADLSWTGGDPDAGDTVTYDVYFGTSSPPPLKETVGPYPAMQTSITYELGTLNYNTKYYWYIVATDNHNASTPAPLMGDIWDFTTGLPGPTVTWNLRWGLDADPAAVNIWLYPEDAVQGTLAGVEWSMPDGLLIWHYGGPTDGWRFYKKGWGASNTLATLVPGDGYIGIVPATGSAWEIPQG